CSQLCDLFLIQLVFCVHSYKETFTILHHSFTNFSHSSIIFFIIIIIKYYHSIQDFCFFFCSASSIHLSITLYTFLVMTSCSHNKHHCSAHTRQFISKSSYVDRSASADDHDLNVELLIENLKNAIMKELLIITSLFNSVKIFNIIEISTLMNFFRIIDLYQSVSVYSQNTDIILIIQIKDICVFRNKNTDIVFFYTHRCETYTSYLRYYYENELFTCCVLLSAFLCVSLSLSEKPCMC
ncbi:hypothetical protein BDBG_16964, partial [Blastomyces gilchristii SLH14081]